MDKKGHNDKKAIWIGPHQTRHMSHHVTSCHILEEVKQQAMHIESLPLFDIS